jgi:hypothetical protein
VDASDAYALSVFPFGRDDERPEDYESEIWETGLMVQGSGLMVQDPWAHHGLTSRFKVNGSRSLGSPRVDWLPALRRVADGRMMAVREDEKTFRVSTEWVIPA